MVPSQAGWANGEIVVVVDGGSVVVVVVVVAVVGGGAAVVVSRSVELVVGVPEQAATRPASSQVHHVFTPAAYRIGPGDPW
jgi:hypothetical protein